MFKSEPPLNMPSVVVAGCGWWWLRIVTLLSWLMSGQESKGNSARKWGCFAENEAPGNERRMRKAKIKDDI